MPTVLKGIMAHAEMLAKLSACSSIEEEHVAAAIVRMCVNVQQIFSRHACRDWLHFKLACIAMNGGVSGQCLGHQSRPLPVGEGANVLTDGKDATVNTPETILRQMIQKRSWRLTHLCTFLLISEEQLSQIEEELGQLPEEG